MAKRFLAVFIVASAVALVAPALAAQRRTYFGPAAGGVNNAGVEISARLSNGKPFKITAFNWQNVPTSCTRNRGATTDQFPKAIKVKDGAFQATGTIGTGTTVTVSGKFKHQNTKMAGKLRVHGNVPGCSGADTGTVSWTAKQPAGQR